MNMIAQGIIAPTPPRTLEEIGISMVTVRDLLLKTMFRTNTDTATALAQLLCIPRNLTQEMIELCRVQALIEATGTLHANSGPEMAYRLTENGRCRALDALAQSEYYGAVPVPLSAWREQVAMQSVRRIRMTRQRLEQAMGQLILPGGLIDQLGPAAGSGRSILLYGPPGNGKSSISNGIRDALGDQIHIPRAVSHAGQIITVYDPVIHRLVAQPEMSPSALRHPAHRADQRYQLCRRPTVVTGGELTLDMLDLTYNPVARTYSAPLQMKAAGGIFIIDDLGRQAEPPQKIVNRWIVPLEEGRDILALQSGEKFEVPFDTLVIFSTNFHPNQIFDKAALRRILYKIRIDGPDRSDYLRIFDAAARRQGLALDEAALRHLLTVKYPSIGDVYASYQPMFLIDQMLSICDFEGLPPRMSIELVDRAWENLFVTEAAIEH
ncbi:ATPase [Paenirhodobacter sp.]|uniref:ATPase n=1 Tax=Paenirhodobacter sp. TaxID=1965326 RepID=UPI003B514ACD